MKIIRLFSVFLVFMCLFSAASAEQGPVSHLGETLSDFEVTTISGEVFRLSDVLKEKEAVFINLWATWCPPCRAEFPYLEEAWQQYQDQVSVIALSVEPNDSNEKLLSFAEENGLSFLIGSDTGIGLDAFLGVTGIPTSLIVDRFGHIAWVGVGAQASTSDFTRLFEAFLGNEYTETVVWDHLPPRKPSVAPSDEAELQKIISADERRIILHNPADRNLWPMQPIQNDSHTALVSTNIGIDDSTSAVYATVTANAGDALAFEFRTSTEAAMDLFSIAIDNTVVKRFGGEHSWSFWALPMPEGIHEIQFCYEKDGLMHEGEDAVWLANLRLLSGDAASEALSSLPSYPVSDEFAVLIKNENARPIKFTGAGASLIPQYFGKTDNWILSDSELHAEFRLTADMDPEAAFVYNYYEGSILPLVLTLAPDASTFIVSTLANSSEITGYPQNLLQFYSSRNLIGSEEPYSLLYFADEKQADLFVELIKNSTGYSLGWEYDEITSVFDNASFADYTLCFTNTLGNPIPGVIVTVCDETSCLPMTSDADGIISFTAAPYPYDIHIIQMPAGYTYDDMQDSKAPEAGGIMTFMLSQD